MHHAGWMRMLFAGAILAGGIVLETTSGASATTATPAIAQPTWVTLVPGQIPPVGVSDLTGISCIAADDCTAVGSVPLDYGGLWSPITPNTGTGRRGAGSRCHPAPAPKPWGTSSSASPAHRHHSASRSVWSSISGMARRGLRDRHYLPRTSSMPCPARRRACAWRSAGNRWVLPMCRALWFSNGTGRHGPSSPVRTKESASTMR